MLREQEESKAEAMEAKRSRYSILGRRIRPVSSSTFGLKEEIERQRVEDDTDWMRLYLFAKEEGRDTSFFEQLAQGASQNPSSRGDAGLVDVADILTRFRCVECDMPTEGGPRPGTYFCPNCSFIFDSKGNAIDH